MPLNPIEIFTRNTPHTYKLRSRAFITRFPGGNHFLAWYLRRRAKCQFDDTAEFYLISFPKCGRTWLRMMLGRALACHFNLDETNPMALGSMAAGHPDIPSIQVIHDDNPHRKSANQLSLTKSQYQDKRVILLIRDVRDIVVSNYFQKTKRDREYSGSLSAFLNYEIGSTNTIINYYNIWAMNRHVPTELL